MEGPLYKCPHLQYFKNCDIRDDLHTLIHSKKGMHKPMIKGGCTLIKDPLHETCLFFLRFQKHVEGTAVLSSDLKSAVFSMAMANGDETTFDQLVKVCY